MEEGPPCVAAEPPPAAVPEPSFPRALLRWALLWIPLVYVCEMLGVWIHEVLGHGLVIRLCGGKVTGIEVSAWGSGACFRKAPGFENLESAAGAAAEALVGALLLLVFFRVRTGAVLRASLLLFAIVLLGGAFREMFGGGMLTSDDADFAKIALRSGGMRAARYFRCVGTGGFCAVTYFLGRLLVARAEGTLGPHVARRGWRRSAMTLVLIGLPGLHLFLLALARLPPSDIYVLPSRWYLFAPTAVYFAVAIGISVLPGADHVEPSPRPPNWSAIAAAWCVADALFAIGYWHPRFGD